MELYTATGQQMATFEGWAHVELMGHASCTGYVRTLYFGNTAILEVAQPEIPPHTITLQESGYCDAPDHTRRLYPAGTEVEVSLEGAKPLVPVASLYRLTPLTERQAMAQMPFSRKAINPPPPALVAPCKCTNCGDYGELNEYGLCADCRPEEEEGNEF